MADDKRIYFGSLEHQQQLGVSKANEMMDVDEADDSDDDGMDVVLPPSSNPAEPTATQNALLAQLELEKQSREIAIPTSDELVKLRLIELEEPIILFAETKAERRKRLRMFLAQKGITQGMPSVLTADQIAAEALEVNATNERPFTEPGSELLRETRAWLLRDSLRRARERLARQRVREAAPNEAALQEELDKTFEPLSKFRGVTSEIGDDRAVSSISFSPNGQYIATAGWTGQCKLWNTENCKLEKTLRGHTERVQSIRWHPDATLTASPSTLNLVSGGADRRLRFWSLDSDKPIRTIPVNVDDCHEDRINKIDFHPTKRFLGATSFDCKWSMWDIESGKCLFKQEGHSRPVYGISFHCDGALVATTGLDAMARIWDIRSGKTVQILRGHVKQILATDWAPNGVNLVTGSDDHTVRVWDIRAKTTLYIIPAHVSLVSDVKYQPGEGNYIVSSSYDKTVKVWSAHDYTLIKSLSGHEGKVSGLDIMAQRGVSNAPRYIASSSFDHTWKLWAHEDLP